MKAAKIITTLTAAAALLVACGTDPYDAALRELEDVPQVTADNVHELGDASCGVWSAGGTPEMQAIALEDGRGMSYEDGLLAADVFGRHLCPDAM